jgi:hypothetical protein
MTNPMMDLKSLVEKPPDVNPNGAWLLRSISAGPFSCCSEQD